MAEQKSPETQQAEGLLTASMRNLHRVAVIEAKRDVNRIPESLFVEWYLPYFAGQLETDIENERALASWMQVAKNQFGEVIVFDDRTNEDLFRVPAMASTRVFNPVGSNNVRALADIITLASQKTHISPAQGQEYLQNSLLKKFDSMLDKKHIHSEQEAVWRSIFQRYNVQIKTAQIAGAAPVAPPPAPDTFGDGELVF